MNPWSFETLANRVWFGAGRAMDAAAALRGLGATRVLVIASPGARRRHGRAIEALGELAAGAFEGVEPHCPIETVEAGEAAFREAKADGLLTIGGGSALGVAKNLRVRLGAPSVAMPTTYSGSEMTPIYGAKQEGRKKTARDAAAKPDLVIYDPELTLDLPPDETATTGMNGLAHCIEAFYPPAPTPFAAAMALEGCEAFFEGLPAGVSDPSGLEGRTRALYGGFVGGLLIQLVGPRLHHRICHVLGGRLDLPHGVSNSVILPYVADFNAAAILAAAPDWTRRFAAPPGAAVQRLARRIGAPRDLKSLGVSRAELEALAAECLDGSPYNPRPASVADVRDILVRAWEGADVAG